MSDYITINEVNVPKAQIDEIYVSIISIPRLSRGHSEHLITNLFNLCSLVSIYYQNNFYCLPTGEETDSAISVLSEKVEISEELKEKKDKFSELDSSVKKRLIVELFRHAAAKSSYFGIYDRVFFKVSEKVDPKFNPAFELTVREFEDSYGLFINPTCLSLATCTKLYDNLKEGDRLIRLCSKRFECDVFKKDGRCRYSYPTYIGLLSTKKDDDQETTEALNEIYEDCAKLKDSDFGVICAKRTKSAAREKIFPSFLLYRELKRHELVSEGIETKLRDMLLPPSSTRYQNTESIVNQIFKDSSLKVNDLDLSVSIQLTKPHELQLQQISDDVTLLKEPMLQFDPLKDNACSMMPSSLFYDGVYDASSSSRPFGKVKPYIVLPKSAKDDVDKLLGWLSNGKTYVDNYGKLKTEFVGLNHHWSKFNCKFIFPDEDDFFLAETEDEFLDAAQSIVNKWNNDNERFVLIVLPHDLYESEEDEDSGYDKPFSLYYQLKKAFVENGIPCQMIETDTFGKIDRYVLQNLLVNIYSKMGGKPWTLKAPFSDVDAFIGIGFGLNPREVGNHIYIGVANIFDSHGEWLDILSDHKPINDDERQSFYGREKFTETVASYKLSEEMAQKIVEDSLKRFKDLNPQVGYPRNVVIHKNGNLYDCEINGTLKALSELEKSGAAFEKIGILSVIKNHNYKLFGVENRPDFAKRVPTRGAVYFLGDDEALLCTTGKFNAEISGKTKLIYSGLGTPRTLVLKNHVMDLAEHDLPELEFYRFIELVEQVFSLSKIHWGSLRTDIHLPVTSLYSNRVAKIISKSGIVSIPKPTAKRPWFL